MCIVLIAIRIMQMSHVHNSKEFECGLYFSDRRQGAVAGCLEHGIEQLLQFWALSIVLFFIKNNDSGTEFCLRFRVVPTQSLRKQGLALVDWAQLSRFYLKKETESSLRKLVL
jgi:hypothetical protein